MERCYSPIFIDFKSKLLKPLILFLLICLFLIISGCSNKEYVNYDFGTYLSKDSDFERNIAIVMPDKEELEKSKMIYYMYYDNGGTDETSECKMIRLTVEYCNENFTKAVQAIEEHSELYYDETMSRQFYYNGVRYNGFILYNNGYCALAYHVCSDSNTISYLAFDCWELQFMDVKSALECFPQFEIENQIG